MITRLLIYLLESCVLSVAYWGALKIAVTALKFRGRVILLPQGRIYLWLCLACFVVNAFGSELLGPEFTVLYKLALLAPPAAALFWLYERLRNKSRQA